MRTRIQELIDRHIKGQGTNVDAGSVLPTILGAMMDGFTPPYSRIKKVQPYFYEMDFNSVDYKFGAEWIEKNYEGSGCKCTIVSSGNYIGRNLDEHYDNSASILIRVAGGNGTYSSIGMVSGTPRVTQDLLDSGRYDDILKVIPFFTTDALNDQGLFCGINLLTAEASKGKTTGTTPTVEERERICLTMLPRYIVDHYASIDDAIADITNYISVYAPTAEAFSNMEFHFFLRDSTKAVILEFVNNAIYTKEVGTEAEYPAVMANFYVNGVTPNEDNTITRNTDSDTNTNGVTPYGQGIERHNVAVSGLSGATTLDGMKSLMQSLFYTNAYTLEENKWYTEFVGGDLKVTSPAEDFADILSAAAAAYASRDRNNPITWQTIHSAVYDLDNNCIVVSVQEQNTYHEYAYNSYYEIPDLNNILGDLSTLETDHKSSLVAAINEIVDIIETEQMIVSMIQSTADRKVIYDEVIAHPHLAKNIVFLNNDGMYYPVNGYKISEGVLVLNTIMIDEDNTLRSVTVNISSNGTISA